MENIQTNWYFRLKYAQINEDQEEYHDELAEWEEDRLQEDFEEERQLTDDRQGNCRNCKGDYEFNRHCGAYVCDLCGDHKGLARCYCGWASSGGDGYRELSEMGDVPIESE
jgi:hypothetical protein